MTRLGPVTVPLRDVANHPGGRPVTGAEAVIYEGSLSGGRGVVDQRAMGRHGDPGSRMVLRILLVTVPLVLAGYALGDRGFAYLASVPGTPLFAGEMILLLGAAFVALATGYLRGALRNSLPMALLLVFLAWGLARTLPLIPLYGLNSIRDAALWYYALMAVLVATLVMAVPDLPHKWARAYAPFVVVLLLWSPVALVLGNLTGPVIPGTGGVPFFSHKPGDIAVAVATAIAFLWLVPGHSLRGRARVLLTGLATVVILAGGTQNRGGLVAAVAAILLTGALMGRQRWKMAAVMIGTVLIGLVVGWGLNVQIPGFEGRDYSVAQLVENAASITQGQNSTGLGNTVVFRDELWSGAINLADAQGALATGLGFGPNLAQELGFSEGVSLPLRSPHNSHIDILARMGIVGLILWVAFWASWYVVMFRRSRYGSSFLSPERRGILLVCVVGVTATLINAYFDPTLENPHGAIWLWTLVGLGLGIAAKSVAPSETAASTEEPLAQASAHDPVRRHRQAGTATRSGPPASVAAPR
jgi:O-antigen ligase